MCRSFAVDVVAMLTAIGLDDQSALGAGEIRDAAPDRLLSAELESSELAIAQTMPEPPFGVGCLTSKRPRMRIDFADRRH